MKIIVKVLALVSLLGIMATACQKETPVSPLPSVVTRTVDYRVGNGDLQRSVIHGDVQWRSFLAAVFDSVDHGHRVSLLHGTAGSAAKDIVTFSSADKAEAMRWVDSMYNAGYDVTLWYDSENHQYNCIGQKASAPVPQLADHPFHPFEEYLSGTWRQLHYGQAFILGPGMHFCNWRDVARQYGYSPSYSQAFDMILTDFTHPGMSCTQFLDADGNGYGDTIWHDKSLTFTRDSIITKYISRDVVYDLDSTAIYHEDSTALSGSVPYYIVNSDSLQIYSYNNLPLYLIIEWSPDTMLFKFTDDFAYGVYVRDSSKKNNTNTTRQ